MGCLGYQWLCKRFRLSAFPLSKPARSAPVSRLTRTADALLVPASVAPDADQPLDQVLFALKHEVPRAFVANPLTPGLRLLAWVVYRSSMPILDRTDERLMLPILPGVS